MNTTMSERSRMADRGAHERGAHTAARSSDITKSCPIHGESSGRVVISRSSRFTEPANLPSRVAANTAGSAEDAAALRRNRSYSAAI
jgi:hypothetical protein